MTAYDYFVARDPALQRQKDENPTNKTEFGGTLGGPIVRDRMHFFFSLERQIVNPSRSRNYSTRPDLDFALSEKWRAWNYLIRVDNQINATNSWAFRWLRELAPQFNLVGNRSATLNTIQDETDDDQIFVGTYTSVIGNSRVNTVRIARTYESAYRGNPCWRANGAFDNRGNQVTCPPQWSHPSFHDNQLAGSGGRDDFNWQLNNTFSWFVPDKGGDHDLKFGATWHRSVLNGFSESNLNGTFTFRDRPHLRSRRPVHLPEPARGAGGAPRGTGARVPGADVGGVRAGQVGGQRPAHVLARRPVRPRAVQGRAHRQPAAAERRRPGRREQRLAAHLVRVRCHRRRPVGAPGRVRDLLRQDAARLGRQHPAEPDVHEFVHFQLPAERGRPGPGERDAPDPSAAAELPDRRRVSGEPQRALPLRGSGHRQRDVPAGDAPPEPRHRLPRFPQPQAAVHAPDHVRLRAGAGADAVGVGRLHPQHRPRHARADQLQHPDAAGDGAQRPAGLPGLVRPARPRVRGQRPGHGERGAHELRRVEHDDGEAVRQPVGRAPRVLVLLLPGRHLQSV